MIHPENVNEAVTQILMAISDLGIHIGDTAVLASEVDQGPRLRLLGQMAEDIVTLVRASEAILRNVGTAAP
ncbi:hypothetical protein [uncultured Brevundimonas sp.]|uniref:hypothetical protein n=1 Tax=uncultured Brevundimonas sp. TaxID=213418 RepID=UPI00260028D7|nr:hypothetical protein [uncultured Brevundimonas sp.]